MVELKPCFPTVGEVFLKAKLGDLFKIMPSKMEVASQHWTDWTDSTVEKIEINRKI